MLSHTNRPDKYETSQVVAFVQQLLSHGGYYDDTLDFIRIERIQVRVVGRRVQSNTGKMHRCLRGCRMLTL